MLAYILYYRNKPTNEVLEISLNHTKLEEIRDRYAGESLLANERLETKRQELESLRPQQKEEVRAFLERNRWAIKNFGTFGRPVWWANENWITILGVKVPDQLRKKCVDEIIEKLVNTYYWFHKENRFYKEWDLYLSLENMREPVLELDNPCAIRHTMKDKAKAMYNYETLVIEEKELVE